MITALIVEDEPEASRFLSKCIKQIIPDCKTLHFDNGEKALEVLDEVDVDVLFVDRNFPNGMDGVTFVKRVRSNIFYLTIPIVFISALDTDKDEILRKYKNFEYLVKPYTSSIFNERLQNFLISIRERKKSNVVQNLDDETRVIRTNGKLKTIKINDILFAEVYYHLITLYTVNNIHENIKMSIEKFINLVNYPLFIRCQKSYAVNIRKVKSLKRVKKEIWINFEGCEKKCLVGLSFIDNVLELINAHNK